MDLWSKAAFTKERFINMVTNMGNAELIGFSIEQEEQYLETLIERDMLIEFMQKEGYDIDSFFRRGDLL